MVTTTTTSVTTIVSIGSLAVPLGAAAAVVLLALLVQKELVSTMTDKWAVRLGKVLNAAIVPLLIAFSFSVVMKVISIIYFGS